jgi:hypothetical protein
MQRRLYLSFIWLVSLALSVCVIESYVHATTRDGYKFILPEDRDDQLPKVLAAYGAYIGGILIFWFIKPFPNTSSEAIEKYRGPIAYFCTIFFNAVIVYFLFGCYLSKPENRNFAEDCRIAINCFKWLSFIVAPVNAFYFGTKERIP